MTDNEQTTDDAADTDTDAAADAAKAAAEKAAAEGDVKEQMRLALEAKHGRHGTAAAGTSPEKAAKADTHAHGKSQQNFRRRSGSA